MPGTPQSGWWCLGGLGVGRASAGAGQDAAAAGGDGDGDVDVDGGVDWGAGQGASEDSCSSFSPFSIALCRQTLGISFEVLYSV